MWSCSVNSTGQTANNCEMEAFNDACLVKLIKKAPEVDIYIKEFNFNEVKEDESLFIDSISFKCIYQNDTLLQKYNSQNDFGYLIAKKCKQDYIVLVIVRYFGEWIKTLELLTYNHRGKLKGVMTLAATGGDIEDYFEAMGKFKNDSVYVLKTVKKDYQNLELQNDNITFTYYILSKDGSIYSLKKKDD